MTFGESKGFMKGVSSDDAEARRVFDAALEAGIRHTTPPTSIARAAARISSGSG